MLIGDWNVVPLMPPPRDDQYISLSPTDSPGDDAATDLGAAARGPGLSSGMQARGNGSDPTAS